MAEQISHNVVDAPESVAASAPADVHANTINISTAVSGQPIEAAKLDIKNTQTANDEAAATNPETRTEGNQQEVVGMSTTGVGHVRPDAQHDSQDAIPEIKTSEDEQSSAIGRLVNGINPSPSPAIPDSSAVEDGISVDNSVDASVSSDADNSRADASEQTKDGITRRVRSNSVKKPAGFSKVSVAKNFLAKSATVMPPPVKPGETAPVGILQQALAAKPRLVAKSGSGLRDTPRARLGSEGASGPDASKVWNKNRPVAPPPPRQFTDEELKQQYGIHLATRLQSDETSKEKNWADIDDDEDDWAPDTVVWMDGTKSTLTSTEVRPIPAQDQRAIPEQAKPAEGVRPVLMLKKPTDTGPPKTILKPGAAIQAKQQNGANGGKGPSDKPSLVAKSPAPTPAKSPWASLPPVDKISPIISNPPQALLTQAPLPFASQDARSYEPMPPLQQAREIAADTFDRSWREGERGTRELFNAQSGRYEAVPEGRRGSKQPSDGGFRKPAVLQRPSQQSVISPAEPSAAFQTRSGSQTEGSWPQRRGSSVSQAGSLPRDRRVSVSKPSDLSPATERRMSTVIGHDMRASPQQVKAQPVFSQQSAWQQQMPPPPPPNAEPVEDAVVAQARIMKEKRELARKRRLEEEERDEAAKKERLRVRLEALAHAGKSKSEQAAAVPLPGQEPPAQPIPAAGAKAEPQAPEEPSKAAETTSERADALEFHLQLPSSAEQIGIAEMSETATMQPLPPRPQDAGLPARPSSGEQPVRQAPRTHLSPRSAPRAPYQQGQPSPYRPPQSSYSSPGDRKTQPFGRSPVAPQDAFASPWGKSSPSGNVWGTAGIGNGTFDAGNSFSQLGMPQQQGSAFLPPGVIQPTGSSRISPQASGQGAPSPSLQQQRIAESPQGGLPGLGDPRAGQYMGQQRMNGVSPVQGMGRQAHVPGPIAPPSRAQPPPPQQASNRLSAWQSAATDLPNQYKGDAANAERKKAESKELPPPENTSIVTEKFKQTSIDHSKRLGAPRKFAKTEYTVHDAEGSRQIAAPSPMPPNAQTQPSGPYTTASPFQEQKPAMSENTVRLPNGEPSPAYGGYMPSPAIAPPGMQQPLTAYPGNSIHFPTGPLASVPAAGKDQSPPPPETSSHPVNDGITARHPHVKLPPPPPVVKLPPVSAVQSMQPLAVIPQRPMQTVPPVGAQPLVKSGIWQARFTNLFARQTIQTETPPSPPKTPPKVPGPALAVAASSRSALDVVPARIGATVSLPQAQSPKRNLTKEGFCIDDSDEVVSKPSVERMFSEELSHGSLPKVRVPRLARYSAMPGLYDHQHNLLGKGSNSRFLQPIDSCSRIGDDEFGLFQKHKFKPGIYIHIGNISKHVGGTSSGRNSRKPSSKFDTGKATKESGTSSPAASHTSGTPKPSGSRNTSFQKARTPTSMSAPPAGSQPASPSAHASSGAPKSGPQERKSSRWPRPRQGANPPPIKSI